MPGPVVLAIWGRETDFGRYKLPYNALGVLATQGYLGRRKDYFRQEFLVAIKMIEDGLARPADMRSSWGGAMGLTQFLPSEFYKHAVDFDGDGRADIFNSIPDALASAAKQLAAKGWERGERWAYEVRAPSQFDCTQGVPEIVKPIREWLRLGFVPVSGRKLTAAELSKEASVLQPEGALGPAFLTPKNYFVIKEYNFSDLYVLFVGQLSDRIAGGRGFEQPWGKISQMRTAQVEEMQNILTARGLYQSKIDGKAGMQTRSALGAYQKAGGLPARLLAERSRARSYAQTLIALHGIKNPARDAGFFEFQSDQISRTLRRGGCCSRSRPSNAAARYGRPALRRQPGAGHRPAPARNKPAVAARREPRCR